MSDLGWRADGIERARAAGGIDLEIYRRPGFMGFVLAWIYRWGARQERALAAMACGDRAQALADFEILRSLDVGGEPAVFFDRMIGELEGGLTVAV